MHKVAYVAGFDFENSPAATNRFLSLFKILDRNFCATKVLTTYPLSKKYDDKTEYWKIRSVNDKFLNLFIIFRLFYYILKNGTRFDTYIIYGGYAFYMLPFILLRPFFKYKIVYDSVEIYLPKGYFKIILSPNTWNHLIGYNFLIRFFDGAICISSYIQEKHQKQGLETVIVPPIFLNENLEKEPIVKSETTFAEKIKILFYGFPGKKEALYNLVSVFLTKKSLTEIFEVTIIGLEHEQFKEYCRDNRIFIVPDNFFIKGKFPLHQVYEELMKTHFTFLQRPYTVTTEAGFPSKLVESLFFRVPLILNLTSDMCRYDIAECSVVCKDDSVESLESSLMFIKEMKKEEINILRNNCGRIYENYFSSDANSAKIKNFIEKVIDDI